MRDILEGVAMAVIFLVVLLVAYLLVVFLLAGANFEEFIRILKSLWRTGVGLCRVCGST
jgi:hypothetical protein